MDRAPGARARQGQGRRGVDDAAVYGATGSQELTSILNAPEASTASTWLAWPFAAASSVPEVPPPLPPGTLPEVHMEDFARYLRKIGDRYDSFEQDRAASEDRVRRKVSLTSEELRSSQGQGLVAALREVPAVFFQESFELDRPEVWGLLGDVESEEGRQEAMEKLGHYLDVVETHLVREIAARTDNFFDASGHVQDLRGTVLALYQQVAALRAQMSQLEKESGAAVQASQRLQQQRANVLATLDTLKAMEEVAQAQAALQGLLPQAAGGGGVAADFVGAIDVLEVLQGVLDNQELLALDCFRTLPQQIAETAQAVDDLMATDFLERARFGGEGAATSRILQRLAAQLAGTQTPRGGPAAGGGTSGRSRLSSEGSVGGTEAEVAAAAKLTDPASLDRVAAWVEAVWEEGPAGGMDGGAAGSEEALQEVLLPLVMGMRRMGRLSAALKDLRDVGAAGMVDFMRRVVEDCLVVLTPGGSDSVHLVAGRDGSPGPRPSTASLLQQLPGDQFQWVLEAALLAARTSIDHFTRVQATVQSVLLAAKAPHQQVAAAAAECQEVCHAVAEVAVVRWAKLLSGRAHGGAATAPRLAELRQVLELTDTLASLAEAQGAKPALGLRSALQQLCKASLDAMHTRALGKLTSLLEAEQWSVVEVPPPFQQVVDRLVARAKPAAAQASAKQPGAKNGIMAQRQPSSETAEANAGSDGAAAGAGAASSPRHPLAAPAPAAAADAAAPSPAPLQPHQPRQVPQEPAVLRKFTITPHTEPAAAAAAAAAVAAAGVSPGVPQDVLFVEGQRYHVVNTALLLLSMVGDYLAFRDAVPAFSAEVAQRVLELLKIFNSRTCQLVLGAGAMQVSGLKSITAKHLAISCQCLGVYIALHPCLAAVFTQGVPQPRADLLSSDFARAAQDYEIHRDEICSKLVFIMRERLAMNLKQLPAVAASWPSGPLPPQQQQQQQALVGDGGLGLPPPSGFAATNVKQLQILSGVLSPLLLGEEAASIFSRVALMFSSTLVEAFGLLESRGPAWEQQLQADVRALLECLERLPMDDAQREFSLERLRLFYTQRFERKQQQQQQQQQEEKRAGPAAAAEASGSTSQPPTPHAEASGGSQPPTPHAETSGGSQPPTPPAEASGEAPAMPDSPSPQAAGQQAEGQHQQGPPALAGHPLAEPQVDGDPLAAESTASLQPPSLESQGSGSVLDVGAEAEAAQPQQDLGGQHSSSSDAAGSSSPDLHPDGPSSTAGPDSSSAHPGSSDQASGQQQPSLTAGHQGSELWPERGPSSKLGANVEQQQQQQDGKEPGLAERSEDRLAGVEVSGSGIGHPLQS